MRVLHAFLYGLAVLLPTVCHAQTKCPWMNEATARGILGGPVALTVDVNDHGDGVCDFSRQHGAAIRHLHISVFSMTEISKEFPSYLAQCPPKSSALRAIGNEAVFCTTQGSAVPHAEKVVGRVRMQAFVVDVSSTVQDDPSMPQGMRRDKANLAAELVAGILF
jgi:hypothetical protein